MLVCALLLTGCNAPSNPTEQTPTPTTLIAKTNTSELTKSDNRDKPTTTMDSATSPTQKDPSNIEESQSFNDVDISWEELSESGVNEALLLEHINQEDLETIAAQLQELVRLIGQKGEQDRTYWLTAQWFTDTKNSEQYKNVVAMGQGAVKPLYLILYKSPDDGFYEYVCAMALDEITGYKVNDKYPDVGWVSAKDFLTKFNDIILEEQEPKRPR